MTFHSISGYFLLSEL